jgi:uncharacterized protein
LKVCIDTNVFVSGVYWAGLPGQVIDLWVDDQFLLIVSVPILEEYREVLVRLGSRMSVDLSSTWISKISQKVTIITTPEQDKRWCRDEDDDKFINCAIRSRSYYLISGDKDILELKEKIPVEIVTPREFMKVF